MTAEKRTIQLTIISATNLKKAKKFGFQNCFAVAYIYPDEMQASHVDKHGGVNPTWNSNLTLTCDESRLHQLSPNSTLITVEIFCNGFLGAARFLGEAMIPLSAVMSEVQCMAFNVLKRSRKHRGVLYASVKLGKYEFPSVPQMAADAYQSTSYAGASVYSSTYNPNPAVGGLYPPMNQDYLNAKAPSSSSEEPVMGYPAFAPLGPTYNPYVHQEAPITGRQRRRAGRARGRKGRSKALKTTVAILGASVLALLII